MNSWTRVAVLSGLFAAAGCEGVIQNGVVVKPSQFAPTIPRVPGADRVRLTTNGSDVSACVAVGPLSSSAHGAGLQNQAAAVNADTVFVYFQDPSGTTEGIGYRCPPPAR